MRKIIAMKYIIRDVFREMPLYKALPLIVAFIIMLKVLVIKAIQIFIPFTYIAI